LVIKHNYSLQPFNTFGIDVRANAFAEVVSVEELEIILQLNIKPFFFLGGGSNILLLKNLPGIVIKNHILGKTVESETAEHVVIGVGGGENWHELIEWTLLQNYGGLENLSLIPGTVGAAPIQNIGAYGVELKDVFEKLEAIELSTGEIKTFSASDCHFGYRDSVFKKELKGRYFISKVYLKLTKKNHFKKTGYGAIQQTLAERQIENPTIQDISDVIVSIRSSKLPDPAIIGNSGSFFKNPEADLSLFESINKRYPNMPHYKLPNGKVKIPAGWLIEKCGWKGKKVGNVSSYEKQALVLVNHGGATGMEVWSLAQEIVKSVEKEFEIRLVPEVNVWE